MASATMVKNIKVRVTLKFCAKIDWKFKTYYVGKISKAVLLKKYIVVPIRVSCKLYDMDDFNSSYGVANNFQ